MNMNNDMINADGSATLTTSSKSLAAPPSPAPLTNIHCPPMDFFCRFCLSLMSEPVIHPLGFTADCTCILVCNQLHFLHLDDHIHLPLNTSLLSKIHDWCHSHSLSPPPPISESRALEAIQAMYDFQSDQEEPDSVPTGIERFLMDLRDPRTSTREEALATLVEYTNPDNRSHLSHPTVLKPVLDMLLSYPSTTTTTATSFLFNLSTESCARFKIMHHSIDNGAFSIVSCLVKVLTNCHENGPIEAREYAALTLDNLALEPENKIPMGSTDGLIPALLEYWMDQTTESQNARYNAGMAVKNLITSCEENARRLVEVEGAMEGIVRMAKDRRVGTVRRTAFEVMVAIGGTETGRRGLREKGVMEEMVEILKERTDSVVVERLCLDVMWGVVCDGSDSEMSDWELRVVGLGSGAAEVLKEMRSEWGVEGRCKAKEMMMKMIDVIKWKEHKYNPDDHADYDDDDFFDDDYDPDADGDDDTDDDTDTDDDD